MENIVERLKEIRDLLGNDEPVIVEVRKLNPDGTSNYHAVLVNKRAEEAGLQARTIVREDKEGLDD